MERLSDTAILILNDLHTERLDYTSEYLPLIEAANRLAAYEDFELTPEEFNESIKFALETNKRAHKMLKAQEEGLVVVLPCKLGTPVFEVVPSCEGGLGCPFNGGYGTQRCDRHNTRCKAYIDVKKFDYYMLHQWGTTIFLTHDEAVAAMTNNNTI